MTKTARVWRGCALPAAMVAVWVAISTAHATTTVTVRGHQLSVYEYGARGGQPVLVTSGDGGWIHLAPQAADLLAERGYFVVGVDAKAYLESFTTRTSHLTIEDVPRDYATLIAYALRGAPQDARLLLVGVSEGAGLSVLAATGADRARLAGVIGLGLPDRNELAWRWKDDLIYLTHGMPDEPEFSAAAAASRLGGLPLAAIQSTHDEYVPPAEVDRVLAQASGPSRLWTVEATNHRFSGGEADLARVLFDAVSWVRAQAPRRP